MKLPMYFSSTPAHKKLRAEAAAATGTDFASPVIHEHKVASSALFNGTMHLVDLSFKRKDLGGVVIAWPPGEVDTVLAYMTLATPTILRYTAQYGEASATISQTILVGEVEVDSNTYNQVWLENWVNTLAGQYNIPSNDCICILNPPEMIDSSDALSGGIGGYHLTTSKCRYIFTNVTAHGLTLADRDLAFATTLSHEIAEMIVDPNASSNPEVCDPCAGNCGHVTLNFFQRDGGFLGSVTDMNLIAAYDYFIEGIVQPAFVSNCPAPFSACAYFPEIWSGLGGQFRELAVAAFADGRLCLFALGNNHDVWRLDELAPGGGWGGWQSFGGHDLQSIAVGTNADGRLELFALGKDKQLYHLWQSGAAGAWGQWALLGGKGIGQFHVSRDAAKVLHVYAIASGGECVHISQVGANGGWGAWSSLGGHGFLEVHAGIGVGGKQIVVVADAYHVLHATITPAQPNWQPVPLPLVNTFTVIEDDSGTLNIVALTDAKGAYHALQKGGTLDFSTTEDLAGHDLAEVCAALNADGRLEVFALGGDGKIYHRWKVASGQWSEWTGLGATQDATFTDLVALRTPQGPIASFALLSDGQPATIAQTAPNGGWA